MITSRDIHWLAGFLDGEGYFGIRKSTPVIAAAQKDLWPLDKVKELVGGNIYRNMGGGCKKYGIEPRLINTIHITGKRAVGLMMTLYSLLSPRRQEKIRSVIGQWKNIPCRGEINRKKTHCKNGHKFTPENTYLKKSGRECKLCQKAWNAAYLERKKSLKGEMNHG